MPTKTILLVDDSRTMREVFKVYLMGKGFEIVEAADGARGLELLRLIPVDLLVVDMNLPNTDGPSMVRAVRASTDPAIRSLPVMVITGDKAADAERRAMAAGADLFLPKPLSAERVSAAVEQLLASRS